MQVSVLKRDNREGYMYKMLFRNRVFPDNCQDYSGIMRFVKEIHGYKLGDEFLILRVNSSRRVKIVAGDIVPEWGDV